MPNPSGYILREKKYFRQNGKCYFCGQQMVLARKLPRKETKEKMDMATLYHLDSRHDTHRRGAFPSGQKSDGRQIRVVVAHYSCMKSASQARENAVPLEERQRRAKRFPLPKGEL